MSTTTSSFVRGLGKVLGAAITMAVNEAAASNSRNAALSAEEREAQKWEDRRLAAHAAIQRALDRHEDGSSRVRLSIRGDKAIDLRAEADRNCRNRSEPLMSYTEEQITRFEKHGY